MKIFALLLRTALDHPRLSRLVLGRAIPLLIPLSSGLGLRIERNSRTETEASLPLKRRTRNHVGSVYFGAIATLAEITMGLLLFNLYPPGPFGVLVKRAEFDFLAKARSGIRARCAPSPATLDALASQVRAAGRGEAWFEVAVKDGEGTEVARARFLASVKSFSRG